jgi:uncharacterized cupredoxin-like copper-binding protein
MKVVGVWVACLASVIALSACGGGSGSSSTTEPAGVGETLYESSNKAAFKKEHPGSAKYGSPPLEFEADPGGDLAYTADEVTAKEGNVTIEFTNPQRVPHNVAVEAAKGGRVVTETVEEGFAAVTVTLSSNEKYVFYCTIPGHRKAGMEGIVKVVSR